MEVTVAFDMGKDARDYLRYWYLHELRRMRAVERVHGTSTLKDRKAVQRELARLRRKRK